MSPEEDIIPLDDDDIKELAALAKNADKLSMLLSNGEQVGPRIGTISFSEHLSKKIDLDASEVLPMVNRLAWLFHIRNEVSTTSDEVVETTGRSLERADGADVADVTKAWKDAQSKIIEALNAITSEHPLVVSFDAGSKALSIPNAVLSMEMSTDTRPIFNEAKDRILFTIISHTLTLEYHEGYRRHKEIHLRLNARDIEILRNFCDEAEQAATTLKASIPGHSAVPREDEVRDGEDAG